MCAAWAKIPSFLNSCLSILFIHSSTDGHSGASSFWPRWIRLPWTDNAWRPCCHFFRYICRTGISGANGSSTFNFLRNLHPVLYTVMHHFTFPQTVHKGFNYSTFSPKLDTFFFFYSSHPSVREVIAHCGLIYISLMISDAEYFFNILIGHFYIFFGKMSSVLMWLSSCILFLCLMVFLESMGL